MDQEKQDYLNQISASVRPTKKPREGFWNSTLFKVIVGGIVGFILIAILGGIISGARPSNQNDLLSLDLYINSTTEAITEYQPSLKSSALRSHSASLYSILSTTMTAIEDYVDAAYGTGTKPSESMEADEKLHSNGLTSELFNAKINGRLDRIYAPKMAYEISIITAKEAALISRLNDSSIKESLTSSLNSLNNLYAEFNDFSETN